MKKPLLPCPNTLRPFLVRILLCIIFFSREAAGSALTPAKLQRFLPWAPERACNTVSKVFAQESSNIAARIAARGTLNQEQPHRRVLHGTILLLLLSVLLHRLGWSALLWQGAHSCALLTLVELLFDACLLNVTCLTLFETILRRCCSWWTRFAFRRVQQQPTRCWRSEMGTTRSGLNLRGEELAANIAWRLLDAIAEAEKRDKQKLQDSEMLCLSSKKKKHRAYSRPISPPSHSPAVLQGRKQILRVRSYWPDVEQQNSLMGIAKREIHEALHRLFEPQLLYPSEEICLRVVQSPHQQQQQGGKQLELSQNNDLLLQGSTALLEQQHHEQFQTRQLLRSSPQQCAYTQDQPVFPHAQQQKLHALESPFFLRLHPALTHECPGCSISDAATPTCERFHNHHLDDSTSCSTPEGSCGAAVACVRADAGASPTAFVQPQQPQLHMTLNTGSNVCSLKSSLTIPFPSKPIENVSCYRNSLASPRSPADADIERECIFCLLHPHVMQLVVPSLKLTRRMQLYFTFLHCLESISKSSIFLLLPRRYIMPFKWLVHELCLVIGVPTHLTRLLRGLYVNCCYAPDDARSRKYYVQGESLWPDPVLKMKSHIIKEVAVMASYFALHAASRGNIDPNKLLLAVGPSRFLFVVSRLGLLPQPLTSSQDSLYRSNLLHCSNYSNVEDDFSSGRVNSNKGGDTFFWSHNNGGRRRTGMCSSIPRSSKGSRSSSRASDTLYFTSKSSRGSLFSYREATSNVERSSSCGGHSPSDTDSTNFAATRSLLLLASSSNWRTTCGLLRRLQPRTVDHLLLHLLQQRSPLNTSSSRGRVDGGSRLYEAAYFTLLCVHAGLLQDILQPLMGSRWILKDVVESLCSSRSEKLLTDFLTALLSADGPSSKTSTCSQSGDCHNITNDSCSAFSRNDRISSSNKADGIVFSRDDYTHFSALCQSGKNDTYSSCTNDVSHHSRGNQLNSIQYFQTAARTQSETKTCRSEALASQVCAWLERRDPTTGLIVDPWAYAASRRFAMRLLVRNTFLPHVIQQQQAPLTEEPTSSQWQEYNAMQLQQQSSHSPHQQQRQDAPVQQPRASRGCDENQTAGHADHLQQRKNQLKNETLLLLPSPVSKEVHYPEESLETSRESRGGSKRSVEYDILEEFMTTFDADIQGGSCGCSTTTSSQADNTRRWQLPTGNICSISRCAPALRSEGQGDIYMDECSSISTSTPAPSSAVSIICTDSSSLSDSGLPYVQTLSPSDASAAPASSLSITEKNSSDALKAESSEAFSGAAERDEVAATTLALPLIDKRRHRPADRSDRTLASGAAIAAPTPLAAALPLAADASAAPWRASTRGNQELRPRIAVSGEESGTGTKAKEASTAAEATESFVLPRFLLSHYCCSITFVDDARGVGEAFQLLRVQQEAAVHLLSNAEKQEAHTNACNNQSNTSCDISALAAAADEQQHQSQDRQARTWPHSEEEQEEHLPLLLGNQKQKQDYASDGQQQRNQAVEQQQQDGSATQEHQRQQICVDVQQHTNMEHQQQRCQREIKCIHAIAAVRQQQMEPYEQREVEEAWHLATSIDQQQQQQQLRKGSRSNSDQQGLHHLEASSSEQLNQQQQNKASSQRKQFEQRERRQTHVCSSIVPPILSVPFRPLVVALDVEWSPPCAASLLTLSTEKKIYLFDLTIRDAAYREALWQLLSWLLSNPFVLKLFFQAATDLPRLFYSLGMPASLVDKTQGRGLVHGVDLRQPRLRAAAELEGLENDAAENEEYNEKGTNLERLWHVQTEDNERPERENKQQELERGASLMKGGRCGSTHGMRTNEESEGLSENFGRIATIAKDHALLHAEEVLAEILEAGDVEGYRSLQAAQSQCRDQRQEPQSLHQWQQQQQHYERGSHHQQGRRELSLQLRENFDNNLQPPEGSFIERQPANGSTDSCRKTSTSCKQRCQKPVYAKLHYRSLREMCRSVLGLDLDKSQQRSNWNRRPLTHGQVVYAAADAFILILLEAKLRLSGWNPLRLLGGLGSYTPLVFRGRPSRYQIDYERSAELHAKRAAAAECSGFSCCRGVRCFMPENLRSFQEALSVNAVEACAYTHKSQLTAKPHSLPVVCFVKS